MSKNSYRHVLKYTSLFGSVQGLSIVVGLVRNKITALFLAPMGMGLLSIFSSALNFVSTSTNLGIPFGSVKRLAEVFENGNDDDRRHIVCVVRTWSLVTGLFGMILCAVLGPFLSKWLFDLDDRHSFYFFLLAPVVLMNAVTGGESAVLKGARNLGVLARIQINTVVAALVVAVPFYYFMGIRGIVPVLVSVAFFSMIFTLFHSYRLFPPEWKYGKDFIAGGKSIIDIGIVFVITGIVATGAEVYIRSYLKVNGDLDAVGLYSAGYMMVVTYGGMIFSAMDTDYYPRLSSVCNDSAAMNIMANRQMEVSMLLVSPMLVILIISLPVVIPLLFSSRFSAVIPMAQVAVFSMFFKAMSLPLAYISLVKSDMIAYLIMEILFSVVMVWLVMFFYGLWGLWGAGIALSASHLFELAVIYLFVFFKYHYVLSRNVLRYIAVFLPMTVIAYIITFIDCCLWYYWVSGTLVSIAGVMVSFFVLKKKLKSVDNIRVGS